MANRSPAVVCLGFFDGVHIGHRALLDVARPVAKANGWLVRAHTFDHAPSPRAAELTTADERVKLLLEAGADEVVVSAFDDAIRRMSGEDFFHRVILGDMNARHVVCGGDHRFGYRGATDTERLRAMCDENGVGLTVVPDVVLTGGLKVSSTAIRAAIAKGDQALAARMLGRDPTERMIQRVQSSME